MRFIQSVETEGRVLLDAKDKKLLLLLSQNARFPVAALAKGAGLSRDSVSYRMNCYASRGLVQGYRTVVNIGKFGYNNYHLFLTLNVPTKDEEEKLVRALVSLPFTRAVLKFVGKYDLEIAMIATSFEDFEKKQEAVLSTCGKFLIDYDILVITRTYRVGPFPRSFGEIAVQRAKPAPREKIHLDTKDFSLLRILAEDARASLIAIAKKVNLSADAVSYRLKKMISGGTISNFIPAINYALLGYQVYVVVMNLREFDEKKDATLREFFRTDKHVLWAVRCLGKFNVLFYLCTQEPHQVYESLLMLRSLFQENIKEYELFIAYEEFKYNYLPEVLFKKLE